VTDFDHTNTESPVEGGATGISIDENVSYRGNVVPRSPSEAIAAAVPKDEWDAVRLADPGEEHHGLKASYQTPEDARAVELDALRAAAEEADRPEWLNPKFSSPEQLAEAYLHAERKISQQSEEVRQLRQQLEAVAQSEQMLAAEIEEDPSLAAYSQALQHRALQDVLAQAQSAQQAVREQAFQQVPGLAEHVAPQANAPTDYASQVAQLLDENVQNWQEFAPQIQEAQMRHPALFTDPDPKVVAQRIAGVVLKASNERASIERAGFTADPTVPNAIENENMKLQAQTASGAGTRPTPTPQDEAEWNAIRKAGDLGYADRMRGR
jgi:hypothetical protein